jgi:hypothetical protein
MPSLTETKLTDWITAIAATVSALSALSVPTCALVGLLWLTRERDRSRFDIAKKLISQLLKVRDSLKFVRNPFPTESIRNPTGSKIPGTQLAGDPPSATQIFAERQARYEGFVAEYRELEAIMLEGEVFELPVEEMRSRRLLGMANSVSAALTIGAGWSLTASKRPLLDEEKSQLEEARKTVIDHSPTGTRDELDTKLETVVNELVSPLKKYLAVKARSNR